MRSVGNFFGLLATGVLIVLIYIWSGESLVALVLAIVTLFAVAAIIEWKPWAVDPGTEVFGPLRHPHPRSAAAKPSTAGRSPTSKRPVWRSRFDITWDARGVSGVAVGKVAPQLWSWSQIDDISQAWCEDEPMVAGAKDNGEPDGGSDAQPPAQGPEERVALCLDFPSLRNPEEPEQAPVMFGPAQDPDPLVTELRAAWRDSKISRSRFYDLSPGERTQIFAESVGFPAEVMSTLNMRSPALLYQELRKALLAGGELCRISSDAEPDDLLDRFDGLLEANRVDPLSRTEAEELQAAAGPNAATPDAGAPDTGTPNIMASLHWTLDWVAEQRGLRLVFLDQVGPARPGSAAPDHGGPRDYLVGLIPAESADDWDGQTIGSGSTRVLLDPPS